MTDVGLTRPHSRLRLRLATVLGLIALLAVLLALVVPLAKRLYFPETWNTWIVKTVRRPDGSLVRVRIRRYPHGDVVHTEILAEPSASPAASAAGKPHRP